MMQSSCLILGFVLLFTIAAAASNAQNLNNKFVLPQGPVVLDLFIKTCDLQTNRTSCTPESLIAVKSVADRWEICKPLIETFSSTCQGEWVRGAPACTRACKHLVTNLAANCSIPFAIARNMADSSDALATILDLHWSCESNYKHESKYFLNPLVSACFENSCAPPIACVNTSRSCSNCLETWTKFDRNCLKPLNLSSMSYAASTCTPSRPDLPQAVLNANQNIMNGISCKLTSILQPSLCNTVYEFSESPTTMPYFKGETVSMTTIPTRWRQCGQVKFPGCVRIAYPMPFHQNEVWSDWQCYDANSALILNRPTSSLTCPPPSVLSFKTSGSSLYVNVRKGSNSPTSSKQFARTWILMNGTTRMLGLEELQLTDALIGSVYEAKVDLPINFEGTLMAVAFARCGNVNSTTIENSLKIEDQRKKSILSIIPTRQTCVDVSALEWIPRDNVTVLRAKMPFFGVGSTDATLNAAFYWASDTTRTPWQYSRLNLEGVNSYVTTVRVPSRNQGVARVDVWNDCGTLVSKNYSVTRNFQTTIAPISSIIITTIASLKTVSSNATAIFGGLKGNLSRLSSLQFVKISCYAKTENSVIVTTSGSRSYAEFTTNSVQAAEAWITELKVVASGASTHGYVFVQCLSNGISYLEKKYQLEFNCTAGSYESSNRSVSGTFVSSTKISVPIANSHREEMGTSSDANVTRIQVDGGVVYITLREQHSIRVGSTFPVTLTSRLCNREVRRTVIVTIIASSLSIAKFTPKYEKFVQCTGYELTAPLIQVGDGMIGGANVSCTFLNNVRWMWNHADRTLKSLGAAAASPGNYTCAYTIESPFSTAPSTNGSFRIELTPGSRMAIQASAFGDFTRVSCNLSTCHSPFLYFRQPVLDAITTSYVNNSRISQQLAQILSKPNYIWAGTCGAPRKTYQTGHEAHAEYIAERDCTVTCSAIWGGSTYSSSVHVSGRNASSISLTGEWLESKGSHYVETTDTHASVGVKWNTESVRCSYELYLANAMDALTQISNVTGLERVDARGVFVGGECNQNLNMSLLQSGIAYVISAIGRNNDQTSTIYRIIVKKEESKPQAWLKLGRCNSRGQRNVEADDTSMTETSPLLDGGLCVQYSIKVPNTTLANVAYSLSSGSESSFASGLIPLKQGTGFGQQRVPDKAIEFGGNIIAIFEAGTSTLTAQVVVKKQECPSDGLIVCDSMVDASLSAVCTVTGFVNSDIEVELKAFKLSRNSQGFTIYRRFNTESPLLSDSIFRVQLDKSAQIAVIASSKGCSAQKQAVSDMIIVPDTVLVSVDTELCNSVEVFMQYNQSIDATNLISECSRLWSPKVRQSLTGNAIQSIERAETREELSSAVADLTNLVDPCDLDTISDAINAIAPNASIENAEIAIGGILDTTLDLTRHSSLNCSSEVGTSSPSNLNRRLLQSSSEGIGTLLSVTLNSAANALGNEPNSLTIDGAALSVRIETALSGSGLSQTFAHTLPPAFLQFSDTYFVSPRSQLLNIRSAVLQGAPHSFVQSLARSQLTIASELNAFMIFSIAKPNDIQSSQELGVDIAIPNSKDQSSSVSFALGTAASELPPTAKCAQLHTDNPDDALETWITNDPIISNGLVSCIISGMDQGIVTLAFASNPNIDESTLGNGNGLITTIDSKPERFYLFTFTLMSAVAREEQAVFARTLIEELSHITSSIKPSNTYIDFDGTILYMYVKFESLVGVRIDAIALDQMRSESHSPLQMGIATARIDVTRAIQSQQIDAYVCIWASTELLVSDPSRSQTCEQQRTTTYLNESTSSNGLDSNEDEGEGTISIIVIIGVVTALSILGIVLIVRSVHRRNKDDNAHLQLKNETPTNANNKNTYADIQYGVSSNV